MLNFIIEWLFPSIEVLILKDLCGYHVVLKFGVAHGLYLVKHNGRIGYTLQPVHTLETGTRIKIYKNSVTWI